MGHHPSKQALTFQPSNIDDNRQLSRKARWIGARFKVWVAQHINVVVIVLTNDALGIYRQPSTLLEIEDIAMVRIPVQDDLLTLITQQLIGHYCAVSHKPAFLLCHGC